MFTFCNFIYLCLAVHVVTASPQRSGQQGINQNRDINNRGFGEVVQPENLIPTENPMILTSNGQMCKCIPYHMCQPEDTLPTTKSRFFGEIDVRFTPNSCQDLLDVCCAPSKQTNQKIVPPPETLVMRPSGCGFRNVNGIDFSMTGNMHSEAGFGEFPWMVALMAAFDSKSLGGGSLIHPSIVLTAAHSVFNKAASDLKIRAGEWDTQTDKERLPHQERNVRQIMIHPSFHKKSLANDIALLILEQPVQLDQHINVVCLPQENYFSTSPSCFASGWGKDVFGQEGKYSVIMKKVELPMVASQTCEENLKKTLLGERFFLHTTFVCAGGQQNADMCQGDGGSPLVCPYGPRTNNRYIQIGVVSWGVGCSDNGNPGVYTNVPMFRNWIDKVVQDNGFDPNVYSFETEFE